MPNFDTSNLLTAQTMVSDTYAAPEMRMSPITAFDLLSRNDEFLVVGADTLKTRDDRPIEAHLLARTKRASGSARAHDHTGTIDDTIKETLTWTTKSDKTSISLKLLNKSNFDFNKVLANKLAQCCMNILEDKEAEAIAYLLAQRSQYSVALKGASFNTDNDCIDIAAANKEKFYSLLKSAFRRNKHSKRLDIIADSLAYVDQEWLAAQGAQNDENQGFSLNGTTVVESIDLDDNNYNNGLVIAMPAGTACALNWIPQENRDGWGDYNTYEGGFGTFEFMGYTFALHGYLQRADTSAANGDKQDVKMEFELSLDSSYNKAPLSTTNAGESVIFQAGVAA